MRQQASDRTQPTKPFRRHALETTRSINSIPSVKSWQRASTTWRRKRCKAQLNRERLCSDLHAPLKVTHEHVVLDGLTSNTNGGSFERESQHPRRKPELEAGATKDWLLRWWGKAATKSVR